jgi:protease-4
MYFKGTLDKLEIEAQIFREGKYKSAVEIYSEKEMSKNDKEQFNSFLKSISEEYYSTIAGARNLPIETFQDIFNNFKVRSPEDAIKYGIVDSLCYFSDVLKFFKEKNFIYTEDNILSIHEYANAPDKISRHSSDRIAVVYATGEITGSSGDDNEIGIDNIIESLNKARYNRNVKAIVLRVNSPGGIPLTSDLIMKTIKDITAEKPVIVSMGNVAASGGYYISAAADSIVAEKSTLTGSIGVYGMIPNIKDFLKNKLGITVDGVNTGKFSDYRSIFRPVTMQEREFIEEEIAKVYSDFINVVSEGRNLTPEQVDEIAQGRIWSGSQAKEIGLVDELGGLERAIEIASAKAGILTYKIIEYPELKEPFQIIVDMFSEKTEVPLLKSKLGDDYKYYRILEEIRKVNGIQTRMPYNFEIY